MRKYRPLDFLLHEHGTITLLEPLTERAHDWTKANMQVEDWQRYVDSIAIEPRLVKDIVEGAQAAGLTVETSLSRRPKP
jgi:hypothetical protein